jgi:PAS domain S-box-containing protein
VGYATRPTKCGADADVDANSDTNCVPVNRREFRVGLDPGHSDGEFEAASIVSGSEHSNRGGGVAGRILRRDPWGERAETEGPLHEPIIPSELERIARIGSWSLRPTGLIRWSDEMYRVLGVSPDTFIPDVNSWLDLTHPEDRRQLQAWIKACARGDECDELEFRAVLPDGSIRWICGRVSLQKFCDNSSPYIAGTAEDITDRKTMEQNLSAAVDYNRLLVDVCPVGVTVLKATGECVSTNKAAAAIVGATVEQVRGQNFRELKSWCKSGLFDMAAEALATNTTVERDIHINPSTFGKIFWISTRIVPFIFNNEQYILTLYSDITEKKRIEELNAVHVAKLEAAFMQTVEAITALSAMRDPYTAGHERRVAEIAVAIGAEMGLDAHRQQGLRVAGYLHDVGKINAPAEILSKPGALSAAEFALVKEHARAGYDVLKNVEFPWPVALVALQHHERIDGSGYPQGLKGDEIILEARIVAVADVVEAIASHRPYRAALGIEKSLAEIERGRGTAFDADVVDACLRLFRERGHQLPA